MFKVFKEECIEGFDEQENSVVIKFLDSFKYEWQASNMLDDLYEKALNEQRDRHISRDETQFHYNASIYNTELGKSIPHSIRYYIEECRTVMNGDVQIDVSNQDFDFIDDFYYGRAVVKRYEKYGIVDEPFKIILPIRFWAVTPYEQSSGSDLEPFARVDYEDNRDSRLVDLEGNFIVRAEGYLHRIPSDYYYPYISDSRWVKLQIYSPEVSSEIWRYSDYDTPIGNYTFYDVERYSFFKFGNYPGPMSFEENSCAAIDGFEGDVARFIMNNKCGLVNSDEKVLAEPQYEQLLAFSDGLSAFKTSGEYKYVNLRNGEIKQEYPEGGGKWGFIDKSGREVIPAQYDMVRPFSAGHAAFNLGGITIVEFPDVPEEVEGEFPPSKYFRGGKWGFIDIHGNVVIEAKYDWISPFAGGMIAIVCKDQKYGLITADLKNATDLIYERIRPSRDADKLFSPVFVAYLYKGFDQKWGQNLYSEYEIVLQKDGFVVKDTGCISLEENI